MVCVEIDTNQYPISADLGSRPHRRLTAIRLRRTPPAECQAKQSNGTSVGHHAKHGAPRNQMLAHLVDRLSCASPNSGQTISWRTTRVRPEVRRASVPGAVPGG